MSAAKSTNEKSKRKEAPKKPLPGTGIPREKQVWDDLRYLKRSRRREEQIRRAEEEHQRDAGDDIDHQAGY